MAIWGRSEQDSKIRMQWRLFYWHIDREYGRRELQISVNLFDSLG
jgi:hypothetical protein